MKEKLIDKNPMEDIEIVDQTNLKTYDCKYFNYCQEKYNNKEIRDKIDTYRAQIVNKIALKHKVLDIGIGSGTFIEKRNEITLEKCTFGYDKDKQAVEWLKKNRYKF